VSVLRQLWVVVGLWVIAGSASAQVQQGTFRLWLDTELLSYQRLSIEEDEQEETYTNLGFGPGALHNAEGTVPFATVLGLGFGYVAHPHVIPQLGFSFGYAKSKAKYEYMGESESNDGPSVGTLVLQPRVEVPFNPESTAVVGALLGFDLRRVKISYEAEDEGEEDASETVLGYGPVFGLTTHFFIAPPVSIDLSALMQIDFLSVDVDPGSDPDPDTFRQLSFGILVGLSAWPGA
jgi:hypothetical protein